MKNIDSNENKCDGEELTSYISLYYPSEMISFKFIWYSKMSKCYVQAVALTDKVSLCIKFWFLKYNTKTTGMEKMTIYDFRLCPTSVTCFQTWTRRLLRQC